jgi:beta-lactamase superfamily II metal-dependent hydrolase
MIDINFIAGLNSDPKSTSSYDAIVVRFKQETDESPKIIVIDGGFSDVGNDVVNFVVGRFGADKIDLMISTHPDGDHLNGLLTIIQQIQVDELMVHQPRLHQEDLSGFTNLENLDLLLGYAESAGTTVTEPFMGVNRFDAQMVVLGPSEDYYKELLHEQLDPFAKALYKVRSGFAQASVAIKDVTAKALGQMPEETLDDSGITSPRNNSSVITLLNVDGHRMLFTGDAGITALEQAANIYEVIFGSFQTAPLHFFQAPHHGSRRNLGVTLLNRIFGEPGAVHSTTHTVFVHAANASKKHPSPKITNALIRRGLQQNKLGVTNGISLWHGHQSEMPTGYNTINPYPILPEDEA